jgi:hypothetical protein
MVRTCSCTVGDAFFPLAVKEMVSKSLAFFSVTGNDHGVPGGTITGGGLKKLFKLGISNAFEMVLVARIK